MTFANHVPSAVQYVERPAWATQVGEWVDETGTGGIAAVERLAGQLGLLELSSRCCPASCS
jgi:hypothetical protein